MKHAKYLAFVLAFFLPASTALAQTEDPGASTPPEDNEISAARSRYTQTAGISHENNDGGQPLAQLAQGKSGMPLPPHRGYPQQENYPSRRMDRGSAGHALIGAAIGFTLGALVGAKANKNPRTTAGAVVIVGGFGALFGGLIDGAHRPSYAFAHHGKPHRP
jgi:hypothetical protein